MIIDSTYYPLPCKHCLMLTSYCEQKWPDKRGYAVCYSCAEKRGLVPLDDCAKRDAETNHVIYDH